MRQYVFAAELNLNECIRLLAFLKLQRTVLPCLQHHLDLVKRDMAGTAHAYLPDGIEDILIVVLVLPAVLEQMQEILAVILVGKVYTEELTHLLGHLPQCHRALERAGLLHQGA